MSEQAETPKMSLKRTKILHFKERVDERYGLELTEEECWDLANLLKLFRRERKRSCVVNLHGSKCVLLRVPDELVTQESMNGVVVSRNGDGAFYLVEWFGVTFLAVWNHWLTTVLPAKSMMRALVRMRSLAVSMSSQCNNAPVIMHAGRS